jgi:hypothetical protein
MDPSILDEYDPASFYCEMLRSAASRVVRERLAGLSINALKERAAAANAELYNPLACATISRDASLRGKMRKCACHRVPTPAGDTQKRPPLPCGQRLSLHC